MNWYWGLETAKGIPVAGPTLSVRVLFTGGGLRSIGFFNCDEAVSRVELPILPVARRNAWPILPNDPFIHKMYSYKAVSWTQFCFFFYNIWIFGVLCSFISQWIDRDCVEYKFHVEGFTLATSLFSRANINWITKANSGMKKNVQKIFHKNANNADF